ncbi:hypothetical protein FACHB389_15080 [Nostoc calcicola FACHB-389]|nr:hypothetical protein [Nostoc calcicola FACHB-3891]OKH34651.1 hypothetical protein FACHB389_15080 [Nostoc calcicola FACHB-389]
MKQTTLFDLEAFTKSPVPTPLYDPAWDEVETAPQHSATEYQLFIGDWVRLDQVWMDRCLKLAGKEWRKNYQYKSTEDLKAQVFLVHPDWKGAIYVTRNGQAVYVPKEYYTPCESVGGQNPESQLPCESVGGQVTSSTLNICTPHSREVTYTTEKSAPQHDTHWVEKYWVERSGNRYWYYRYCWMVGRKIHRRYLGSVDSQSARHKKSEVEIAIGDGQSPAEIEKMIRSWCSIGDKGQGE